MASEHNVPAPLTTLIGRARELDGIGETLRRTRLVTLTGPGGVGKTRLALELAHSQIARRPGGVWLVDLAAQPEKPDVAAETARTLDVRDASGTGATDALRRYLVNRDVLLVLDNCERVVDACAALAAALLSSCRDVRIMATSREPLGVNGETIWRLEPLGREEAFRLFVERARQRRPEFMPGEQADATIERLCERLDGLPLAIELAAARIGVMSPAEILASLERRLEVLGGGGRLAHPHHRTVRAAIEWSHQLLDAPEQRAFRGLAVFAGGFESDAAAAVVPGLSLDVLARLVDKSLVTAIDGARGRTRYRLLETLREFALELLVAAGELDAARDRHLGHFGALGEVARREWRSTGRQRFVNELDDDYENVRGALAWAAATDPCAGTRLLGGTRDLFFRFGQADGLRLAGLLLERCQGRDRHRAEAQMAQGQLAISSGDYDAARVVLAEARELAGALGDRVVEAWTRFFQGLAETLAGADETARAQLEASRALHHELGILVGEARAVSCLGMTYLMAGDIATARELLDSALAMYAEAGDGWGQGQCHTFLGVIADSAAADPVRAAAHYREGVDFLRPTRDATLLPVALIGQAGVLVRRDRARVRLRAPAGGRARGPQRPRGGGRRPRRRRAPQQGDRRPSSPLRAHRREPRAPRARQARPRQPHPARHLGARAHSVAIPRSH